MQARGIQSGFDFLDAARRLRHRRDADSTTTRSTRTGRRSWSASLNTLRVAIIGVVLRDHPRHAARRRPLLAQRARARSLLRLRRVVPQHPGAAAAADVVPGVHRTAAPTRSSRSARAVCSTSARAGFSFPVPVWGLGQGLAAIGALAGLVVALLYRRWAQRKFEQTGHVRSMFWVPLAIVVAAALLGWVLGGAPTAWSVPHQGEGFVDGRRRLGHAGVPGGAARPGALHLGVRRRGGARRHRVGLARADRGGQQPGSVALAGRCASWSCRRRCA